MLLFAAHHPRVAAVLWAAIAAAFAWLVVTLAHRRDEGPPDNDLVNAAATMVGTVQAILLTLLTTAVWQQRTDASSIAEQEAAHTLGVYEFARRLPEPASTQITGATARYARAVVNDEWPDMTDGRRTATAAAALHAMWEEVLIARAASTEEAAAYGAMLGEVTSVSESRRRRLLSARDVLPPLLWVFLVAGSVSIVVLLGFFHTRQRRLHAVFVANVAVLLALLMLIITVLDRPFTGPLGVQADAFGEVLRVFAADASLR